MVESHVHNGEWAGGQIPGGRTRVPPPPCLDSQYETVDNIIRIWHIHRTAIPLLLKITTNFIVTK